MFHYDRDKKLYSFFSYSFCWSQHKICRETERHTHIRTYLRVGVLQSVNILEWELGNYSGITFELQIQISLPLKNLTSFDELMYRGNST